MFTREKTPLEVINLLIPHYEKVLHLLHKTKGSKEVKRLAEIHNVDCGICSCARFTFDIDIYDKSWVKSRAINEAGLWYPIPALGKNRAEVIQRIQFRLDTLNELKELELCPDIQEL